MVTRNQRIDALIAWIEALEWENATLWSLLRGPEEDGDYYPPPLSFAEEAYLADLTEHTKETGESYTMVTLTEPAQCWLIRRLSGIRENQ